MWLRIFISAIPRILKLFGVSGQLWLRVLDVTRAIAKASEEAPIALTAEQKQAEWADAAGYLVRNATNSNFLTFLARELAVFVVKYRAGAIRPAAA